MTVMVKIIGITLTPMESSQGVVGAIKCDKVKQQVYDDINRRIYMK